MTLKELSTYVVNRCIHAQFFNGGSIMNVNSLSAEREREEILAIIDAHIDYSRTRAYHEGKRQCFFFAAEYRVKMKALQEVALEIMARNLPEYADTQIIPRTVLEGEVTTGPRPIRT